MNLLTADAVALAEGLRDGVGSISTVDIVVCPVYTVIGAVAQALQGSTIAVGGQNCYKVENGAFTGEISPQMLKDVGCTWTIIGHSERRKIFGESDALLNEKLHYALGQGLKVMFCIGETLEEREGGQMNAVLTTQLKEGLAGLSEAQFAQVAVAYEPVWAIGTGKTATPEQAEEAHEFVRGFVRKEFGGTVADALRIQYGGSVNAGNAAELIAKPNVDGFLVGGAALKADGFATIVKAGA
jgi:triosephosphate isomerase